MKTNDSNTRKSVSDTPEYPKESEHHLPRPVLVEIYANGIYLLDHPNGKVQIQKTADNAVVGLKRILSSFPDRSSEATYCRIFELTAVNLAGLIDRENRKKEQRLESAVKHRNLLLQNVDKLQRLGAIVVMFLKIVVATAITIFGAHFLLTFYPELFEKLSDISPILGDPVLISRIFAMIIPAILTVFACSVRYRRNRRVSESFRQEETRIVAEYLEARRKAARSAIALLKETWASVTGKAALECSPDELTLATLEMEHAANDSVENTEDKKGSKMPDSVEINPLAEIKEIVDEAKDHLNPDEVSDDSDSPEG